MKKDRFDCIKDCIRNFADNFPGLTGIKFIDLQTGNSCGYNETLHLPTASVFKIFLMMALFQEKEQDGLDFSEKVELTDEIKTVGTGILYQLSSGLMLSIKDLMVLMIALSDNTAADMIYHLPFMKKSLAILLDNIQLFDTKISSDTKHMIETLYGRKVDLKESSEDYFRKAVVTSPQRQSFEKEEGNYSSAGDTARALEVVYGESYFSKKSREEMLHLLLLCQNNIRIPAMLPENVISAHKTGSLDRIANDSGIVMTGGGNYILSIYTNGESMPQPVYEKNIGRRISDPIIANLSEEIYRLYSRG